MRGVADEIGGDFVAVTVKGLDMEGQKMEIPARSVRKRFKPETTLKPRPVKMQMKQAWSRRFLITL